MTSLNPSLRLALLQRAKGKKNIFQKGFTLVELMTVIVIVGVLSAVALPSFLSQAGKAKGTEAKAQISSIMKDAAAVYQQGGVSDLEDVMGTGRGTADTCEDFGAPPNLVVTAAAGDDPESRNTQTLFDYGCTVDANDDELKVVATANNNAEQIEDDKITMVIDLGKNTITTTKDETSKLFGGTLPNQS